MWYREFESPEQVLDFVREFSDFLGRAPTHREFRFVYGRKSIPFQNHFDVIREEYGIWNTIVVESGLEPRTGYNVEVDEDSFRERVAPYLEDGLSYPEYRQIADNPVAEDTIRDRYKFSGPFGPWRNLLLDFGYEPKTRNLPAYRFTFDLVDMVHSDISFTRENFLTYSGFSERNLIQTFSSRDSELNPWEILLKQSGVQPPGKDILDESLVDPMIHDFTELSEELGYPPSKESFDSDRVSQVLDELRCWKVLWCWAGFNPFVPRDVYFIHENPWCHEKDLPEKEIVGNDELHYKHRIIATADGSELTYKVKSIVCLQPPRRSVSYVRWICDSCEISYVDFEPLPSCPSCGSSDLSASYEIGQF